MSSFGSDGFGGGGCFGCLCRFWFFLLWSKCPLIVAMDLGGYFARVSFVSPGNPIKKSFRSASAKVVSGGLKSVAWLKATRSAGLADWLTASPENSVAFGGPYHMWISSCPGAMVTE
jgi:hypothetical protein